MLRYVLLAFIALTPLFVSASYAQGPAGDEYRIDLVLSEGGQVIGTPRLTVVAGRPALMTTNGPNAYSLKAIVIPTTIKGNPAADLRLDLRLQRKGNLEGVASPRLIGPLGQRLSYETLPGEVSEKRLRIEARTTKVSFRP